MNANPKTLARWAEILPEADYETLTSTHTAKGEHAVASPEQVLDILVTHKSGADELASGKQLQELVENIYECDLQEIYYGKERTLERWQEVLSAADYKALSAAIQSEDRTIVVRPEYVLDVLVKYKNENGKLVNGFQARRLVGKTFACKLKDTHHRIEQAKEQ